jgi:hypothetical protein
MPTLFYVLVTLGGLLAVAGVVAWLLVATVPYEVRFVLTVLIVSGVAYMLIKVNFGGGD